MVMNMKPETEIKILKNETKTLIIYKTEIK